MSTEVEAKNAAISCAITVARYLGFDDAAEYLETETDAISSISEETARRAVAAICCEDPNEAIRLIHEDLLDSSDEIDRCYARALRDRFPALDLGETNMSYCTEG